MNSEYNIELTITIPTYNRNDILKQHLNALLPQLTKQISIVIYDNFSDVPVAETLKNEIENYSNLKVIRNRVNLGACANIIKCIEGCDSKWMWLLSDDDIPLENSIKTALEYISLYPDASNINFKSEYTFQREKDVSTKGQNEFIEKIDNIHNFFLISLNIYNTEKIKHNLRFAHIFSYTMVPHFVLLLISLVDKNTAIFAKEKLVTQNNTFKEIDESWSPIPLCMGLPVLFELPINVTNKNRQKLTELIMPVIGSPRRSLIRVADLYDEKDNIDIWKYNFEQPYLRLSRKIPFIWQLELLLGKIFFALPSFFSFFKILLKKLRMILNKKTIAPTTDRFNRM